MRSPAPCDISTLRLSFARLPGIPHLGETYSHKTKNHGQSRDFLIESRMGENYSILSGFHQGANALGAQHLPNPLPTFKNSDGLQVRPESTPGGFLRPRPVSSECRFLTTMFTFRHVTSSFPKSSDHRVRGFPTSPASSGKGAYPGASRAMLPQIVSVDKPSG
jgi:hypothetical protein